MCPCKQSREEGIRDSTKLIGSGSKAHGRERLPFFEKCMARGISITKHSVIWSVDSLLILPAALSFPRGCGEECTGNRYGLGCVLPEHLEVTYVKE